MRCHKIRKFIALTVQLSKSEKEFGLIDRDVTHVDHIQNASLSDVKVLPAIKDVEDTINLKPDAKPVFCRARKVPHAMEPRSILILRNFRHILAPVDPGGVMNASTVVWQRKKHGSFRLCADFKVLCKRYHHD